MRKSILYALASACAGRAVFNLGQDVIGGFVGNGTGKSPAHGATIAVGGTSGSANLLLADFGTSAAANRTGRRLLQRRRRHG